MKFLKNGDLRDASIQIIEYFITPLMNQPHCYTLTLEFPVNGWQQSFDVFYFYAIIVCIHSQRAGYLMTTTTDMLCRLIINIPFAQVNDQLLSIGVSGSSIVSLSHNCLLHNFIGISYGLDITSFSHHNTWHIVALDKCNPTYCFVIATALQTDRRFSDLKYLIFSSMAIYQEGKSKTLENLIIVYSNNALFVV